MVKKIKVGLIFGGRSGEHEVSLMSARSVMKAIDQEKYDVIPIGITKEGKWIAGGDPMKALTGKTMNDVSEATLLSDPGHRALMQVRPAGPGDTAVTLSSITEVDVMFPVLHGTFGEDGTVQGLLELANIPYVGAGVVGSAVGMDKAVFKDVMRANGIPVPEHVLLTRAEIERDPGGAARKVEAALRFPIFCKPANLGSSVGVTKAHDRAELIAGLREAARWDRRVLAERGINAREIEVSVLGNDAPIASVPGEVISSREFYDYSAKYLDESSELIIPANLPEATAAEARRMAVGAFKAIDGAGMARVDFLLDKDSGQLYVSEINTIPGFTQISMYPKLWEASGISYTELIDRLIELALERQADKDNTLRSYEVNE
ncbi:MAG: D-alanine--D-alanine ligase [Chloroflexi bacterium]|nr:D-alanine--D-alanine ligase [Chloroflexota bacterium]